MANSSIVSKELVLASQPETRLVVRPQSPPRKFSDLVEGRTYIAKLPGRSRPVFVRKPFSKENKKKTKPGVMDRKASSASTWELISNASRPASSIVPVAPVFRSLPGIYPPSAPMPPGQYLPVAYDMSGKPVYPGINYLPIAIQPPQVQTIPQPTTPAPTEPVTVVDGFEEMRLVHRCGACGRWRSPGFHARHPIAAGEKPRVGICKRCQNEETDEEASSSTTNQRRRRSGIRSDDSRRRSTFRSFSWRSRALDRNTDRSSYNNSSNGSDDPPRRASRQYARYRPRHRDTDGESGPAYRYTYSRSRQYAYPSDDNNSSFSEESDDHVRAGHHRRHPRHSRERRYHTSPFRSYSARDSPRRHYYEDHPPERDFVIRHRSVSADRQRRRHDDDVPRNRVRYVSVSRDDSPVVVRDEDMTRQSRSRSRSRSLDRDVPRERVRYISARSRARASSPEPEDFYYSVNPSTSTHQAVVFSDMGHSAQHDRATETVHERPPTEGILPRKSYRRVRVSQSRTNSPTRVAPWNPHIDSPDRYRRVSKVYTIQDDEDERK